MKKIFNKERSKLLNIVDKINHGNYPHDCNEWEDSNVVIISKLPKLQTEEFYFEAKYVVTRFSRELSWLFQELGEVFKIILDIEYKIEFYSRLADMSNHYHQQQEDKEKKLLLAVLHEAFAILEEIEAGRFPFLLFAEENDSLDELISQAESSGYLGIDETRIFFEEMENKYHDA